MFDNEVRGSDGALPPRSARSAGFLLVGLATEEKTSSTCSQRTRAGMPSILVAASRAMTSASVEE